MSTTLTSPRLIVGVPHRMEDRRREDLRLLTGHGRYVNDVQRPGMLHLAFLRSPHAHARIRSIRAERARALPGVAYILTGSDLDQRHAEIQRTLAIPALPSHEVCFLGQAVALVAAPDRYLAEDAAERIEVDYEVLPAVNDPEQAILPDSPPVDTARPSNVGPLLHGRRGDIEAAFRDADRVLRRRFRFRRSSAHPLETRGIVAEPDAVTQGLVFHGSLQQPQMVRHALASGLNLAPEQVRVVSRDVGGGFGVKSQVYPEDLCAAVAAIESRRPVKWIEDRREHFMAVAHEREQVNDVEAAVSEDGVILGLRARIIHDQGSHIVRGLMVPSNSVAYLTGPYRVPAYEAEAVVAFTNKITTGPYRGTGLPMVNHAIERMMDFIADELGLDPLEVRRRNLLTSEQLPFDTGIALDEGKPIVLDASDYPAVLDAAAEFVAPTGFEERRAHSEARGLRRGRAVAFGFKGTGRGAETAEVRLDASGRVTVFAGTGPSGQGHETTLSRVCAQNLGVPPESVAVVVGDTTSARGWLGTVSCRTAPLAAPAVAEASRRLRTKVLERAAVLFDSPPDEVSLEDGWLSAPGRRMALAELCRRIVQAFRSGQRGWPFEPEAEISASAGFSMPGRTFTFSVHVAEVEVDPQTGEVIPATLDVVYDCGTVINPLIVEGQVHGGVSYGLSMALLEELAYDEQAQLLNANFADYLLPSSASMPRMTTARVEIPSTLNPEGYKGAGEVGDMGPAPALTAAIEDALAGDCRLALQELPITPELLFRAMHAGVDSAAGR